MLEICTFYSSRQTQFSSSFTVQKEIKQQSKAYNDKSDFKQISRTVYQVRTKTSNSTVRIDIAKGTCECACFIKWGICHHLVAYKTLFDKFVFKDKRGRKAGANKKAKKALEYN